MIEIGENLQSVLVIAIACASICVIEWRKKR